jgi:hypothetical protein
VGADAGEEHAEDLEVSACADSDPVEIALGIRVAVLAAREKRP